MMTCLLFANDVLLPKHVARQKDGAASSTTPVNARFASSLIYETDGAGSASNLKERRSSKTYAGDC